mgnify:FL=1
MGNKAKVVGWCPWFDYSTGLEMLVEPMESLFDKHMKGHRYNYNKCPSVNNVFKNTYVLTSPFDAHFELDLENNHIHLFHQSKDIPADFFHLREDEYGEKDDPIMSINFRMLFATEDNGIDLMVTSPYFEPLGSAPLRIIPGRIHISDWWRPTEIAFQASSKKEIIKIKRGDPLLYATFSTVVPEDVIELKEIELTTELTDYVYSSVRFKWYHPRCPLSKLYKFSRIFTKKGKRPKLKFIEK